MRASFIKDPDALLDYVVDWSEWLPEGDTISSSAWEVDDAALVVDSSSNDSTTATVRLSGGTLHQRYRVTNRITTVTGLINDQTLVITIKQK